MDLSCTVAPWAQCGVKYASASRISGRKLQKNKSIDLKMFHVFVFIGIDLQEMYCGKELSHFSHKSRSRVASLFYEQSRRGRCDPFRWESELHTENKQMPCHPELRDDEIACGV